jgi:3D (Asp-Asp-Asp) domain-containing protein
VRGRKESRPALAYVTAAALALAALPAGAGAGPTRQTQALRGQHSDLAARAPAAVLGLYSHEFRIASARAQLAWARARAAAVERERARVAHEVAVAASVLHTSESRLASRLRMLYEQGEPDAIAVILGATSLRDAVSRLDELERSAQLNKQAIADSKGARERLARLSEQLAARATGLGRIEAAAARSATLLAAASAERVRYIDWLVRQKRLKAARIARLDARARQVVHLAQSIEIERSVGDAALAAAPAARPDGARTLTVTVTGYALSGTTASGIPAGWGVAAVDPALIALGTRMTIPGYGAAVAADIGAAVVGAAVDLWFPTPTAARAWGRRTVTITLH